MWGLGGVDVRVGRECEAWEGEDKKLEVGMPMGHSQV